jgi:hypothetical protein
VPHDVRDQVVDFVRRWSEKTEIRVGRFISWLDVTASKFYDWRQRYGRVNEHNGWVPRLFELDKLPSTDSRFKDAAGDIWQHCVNNPQDWPADWVFTDGRLNLLAGCGKTRVEASTVPQNTLVSTTQPDKKKVCVDKTSSSWMCSAM